MRDVTVKLAWERVVLPNGVRLLLFNRPSDATVRLCVGVEYGANDDPPLDAGLAHLLEHLINTGSRRRKKLIESAERLGIDWYSYVCKEYTCALLQTSPSEIKRASEILHGFLFDGAFDERSFENEKKVVIHEIDEYLDDPESRIDIMLAKALFGNHPAGRPIGGFSKTVRGFSIERLKRAHRTNYVPENTMVVLAGNYDKKDIEIVSQRFQSMERRKPSVRRYYSLGNMRTREIVQRKAGLSRAYLGVGARVATATDSDSSVMSVLGDLLGGGFTSRLFRELREKRGLAYDVGCDAERGVDYGLMSAYASVKDRNLNEALKIIRREFARFRSSRVSDSELKRAKRRIIGGVTNSVDYPTAFPETIMEMETLYRNGNALADRLAEISAVSAENIITAAEKYLGEENFATVIIKP